MATISTKISSFINKAQTKIREIAKALSSNFDYQGYQSNDAEYLLLKLYETRNFVALLNTPDRGGLTDKEINDLIDFFWKWLELNKVSFVNYPNLETVIQDNVIVPSGTYALQADLIAETLSRQSADQGLSDRITVLEGFDPGAIFPPGFFNNLNASNAAVFDDDTRLHTHTNKNILDQITQGLFDALAALQAHYASIGEPSGVHVSSGDRTAWNAKISVSQLNTALANYAPLSHTQSGEDKHTINQITGLVAALNQINTDISNMAGQDGEDGREIELNSPDGDTIQWRYAGENTWTLLGTFKGDQGDPFVVDYRGLSSERLSSAFDGMDEGFAFLETDTGYLYFRNPDGGSATTSAGWEDPIKFVGDNGWSPVLAAVEVNEDKTIFEIVDWVGGSGFKPVFDPGLSPPNPIRWYIGPNGVTLEQTIAINIKGPRGAGFGPVIGASGTLAQRSDYDNEAFGFIFLRTDISPQVIYQRNSNTVGLWGGPYAWQGSQGNQGVPGSTAGYLVNQAAHGMSVFRGVAYRTPGLYVQFDSAQDEVHIGMVSSIGSSSLFTLVQVGFVAGLSGLTPISLYYLQDDGTISLAITGRPIFFSISTSTGFVLSSAGGGGAPTLLEVLTAGNDAGALEITNMGEGLSPNSAVTVQQVDDKINAAVEGIKYKEAVRAATTGNITLSGAQTIDGVALVADEEALVKDQSTLSENGIYIVKAGAWVRRDDANTGDELVNAVVTVNEGTTNGNTTWRQTEIGITIDVDDVQWVQLGAAVPDASETTPGKIEIANQTEAEAAGNATSSAGADHARAMTPRGVWWFWEVRRLVSQFFRWIWDYRDETGTTYVLELIDGGKVIRQNNAASITTTVPNNATIAFAVGTRIVLRQTGAGKITITGGVGVSFITPDASLLTTQKQYSQLVLEKTATDTWQVLHESSGFWDWIKTQTQTITGVWSVLTANLGTNTTQIASTAFVQNEIGQYYDQGNVSGAVSVDLSNGRVIKLTFTGNVTSFTFTNEVIGKQYIFIIERSTTNYTIAFTAGKFRFPLAQAPVLTNPTTNGSSPAKAVDVLSGLCVVSGKLDIVMTPDLQNN